MPGSERSARIIAALEGILEPGEEFLVRRINDRIEVIPRQEAEENAVRESHPELYGHLLEVNEQISNAGSGTIWVGMLLVASFCVAVHMQWLDRLIGIDTSLFRSLWVYGVVVLAGFVLMLWLINRMEARVYAYHREHLLGSISETGLTRRTLLAQVQDDKNVENVAEKLKNDSSAD